MFKCLGFRFEGDHGGSEEGKSPGKGKLPVPPRPNRQHSYPKTNKDTNNKSGKCKAAMRQISMGGLIVDMTDRTPLDDLNLIPTSTANGKNSKQLPSLDHGFIVQVLT